MRNTKMPFLLALLLMGTFAGRSFGQQQRVFNWLPANDESVRLDPANYHTGHTFHPGPSGGKNHVDIKAQQPVTVFMAPAEDWNQALQHPEAFANLRQLCLAEHVVATTYVCDMPPALMTLVIRDERNSLDPAVFAGLGAVFNPNDKTDRATDCRIGPISGTEHIAGCVHADPFPDRSINNQQGRSHVCARLQAVQIELRFAHGKQRSTHHRRVVRQAARHHKVYCKCLPREIAPPRWNPAFHRCGIATECIHHFCDFFRRRRNHRQTIRPGLLEVPFDQIQALGGRCGGRRIELKSFLGRSLAHKQLCRLAIRSQQYSILVA